jgi:hypothetical protein
MKKSLLFVFALLFSFAIAYTVSACSDAAGLESCPGITCSDCAAADCDVDCAEDEYEFCGHYGFYDDLSLRCAWCTTDPDPFQ